MNIKLISIGMVFTLFLLGCQSNNTTQSPAEQFCKECASPRCNERPHLGCSDCGPLYSQCPIKQCTSDLSFNPHLYVGDSFKNKKCTDLFFDVHPNLNVTGSEMVEQLSKRFNSHSDPGYSARRFIEHNADFYIENNFTLKWAFSNKDGDLLIAMMNKGLDIHFKNDAISKFALINNQTDLISYLITKGINPHNLNFSVPIIYPPIPPEKVTHCNKNEVLTHLKDIQCDEYNPSIIGYNITCHTTSEYNRCIT